jgi:hypothetical protein
MSGEHGSVCCVPIPNPTISTNSNSRKSNDYLLLGILHLKKKFKNKATLELHCCDLTTTPVT